MQTLLRLCSLRPDFGRNADWLVEQCHKIWLTVGIKGSWKRIFLSWLFSRMISRRRREGSIFLFLLLFYGLIVGKYALICAMEIQKIHIVVHIFSGFALFTELMWLYRRVESLCKLLTANSVPFDLPTNECKSKYCPSHHWFHLKVWSGTTSLNRVRKGRITAKETSITNCEDEKTKNMASLFKEFL